MNDDPQLVRHWLLLRMLSSRRNGVSIADMARETGRDKKTIRRDIEFFRIQGVRLIEFAMDKTRRLNREFFNDHAFGDRFVFNRLKVKVDCLTDMQPGFFQSIPFGNATRKRRYVRGVTAVIGWFVHDSDSHARSRFNGAAPRLALSFSFRSTISSILQLCEEPIERDFGLLQNVTERRTFHRQVRRDCDSDGPRWQTPLKPNVRTALANHRETQPTQRSHDSFVVFGRDFRHHGDPSSRRSQSAKQSSCIGLLQQWGRGTSAAEWIGLDRKTTRRQKLQWRPSDTRKHSVNAKVTLPR
jgi:hypothetical protein